MNEVQIDNEETQEEGTVERDLDLAPNLQLPIDAGTKVIGIIAQRGAGKCLSEETELIDPTTGLPHTIREIMASSQINDVFTLDTCSRVIPTPITAKIDSGMKDCFQVTFASGRSVVTTKEHPFLTVDGWKSLEFLQLGDSAALPSRIPFPSQTMALPDAEVDLLSVLLAEGNYTQRGVSFTSTDPHILEIMTLAASSLELKVKHHDSAKSCEYHLVCSEAATSHSGKAMLKRYNMDGLKATHKIIPDVVYRLPTQQLARFLAIFWMCDGYVDKRGPSIALASEKMVRQIHHLLLRFGIQSRVVPKRAKCAGKEFPCWKLTVYASFLQAFLDAFPIWGEKRERLVSLCAMTRNSNVGFPIVSQDFIQRIKEIAQTRSGRWNGGAMKEVAQRIGWNTPYFWVNSLFYDGKTLSLNKFRAFCEVYECTETYQWIWDSDLFWDVIIEITPVGQRHTYDLTVPPTSCFLANDIVVHNSYTALIEMEEMVERGLFVGYIDPLGIAWGIRSSADGQKAGYPVLIFGGRHGDLPLDPAAGKIVCAFVLEQRQPFILDLSLFVSVDQQCLFVADFIEGFRLQSDILLHLAVDESDLFAPQFPKSQARTRSLDAMDALTRRFRSKGLGTTLITQRPAELHKSVLGQIELLLALRLLAPHDINALDDWIKRNAKSEERTQFLATLSSLPTGTAWAWSPQWLHIFELVNIRTRKTYDSSATPKVGVKRTPPKQIAEINLTHVSEQMAALFEHARANDPALLTVRIKELEDEVRVLREDQPRSPRSGIDKSKQLTATQEIEALSLHIRQLETEKGPLKQVIDELKGSINEKDAQLKTLLSTKDGQQSLQMEGLHAANVNFEQASIQQFYAGTGVTTVREEDVERNEQEKSVVVTPVEETRALPPTSEALLESLLHSERKSFIKLLSLIRGLSASEKTLFIWLIEHDGQQVSSQQLANAVNRDIYVTWRQYTDKLVKIAFIQRWREGKFWYKATFASYREKYFSSVPTSVLVQELVKAATE